jgi:tRNA dimethylallyltransferase
VRPRAAQRMIILVGPTGVGKSDVGFHLARLAGGEIVSADSRLLYRGMDIGTAKPPHAMRDEVPHHFIDVLDPDKEYTCKMFEVEGRRTVTDILDRGRVPTVVGGTGLYVRALTEGIFEGPAKDEDLRARLRVEAESIGKRALWDRLASVDPEKARGIDAGNLVRVIRALEVCELTGRRMSELEKEAIPFDIPFVKLGLVRSREELYGIIDRRVEAMLGAGLVDEVKALMQRGYGGAAAVRDSLGYQEILRFLEGGITYEKTVRLIKRNTRRFAKRQLTWFRKDKEITWVDITGRSDSARIAQELLARLS